VNPLFQEEVLPAFICLVLCSEDQQAQECSGNHKWGGQPVLLWGDKELAVDQKQILTAYRGKKYEEVITVKIQREMIFQRLFLD
jgi:hypothetical protein